MEGRVIGEPGGIASLVRLLDEHGEAVEYDLITLGLRLEWRGTPRLSWRDLLVIVQQSPRTSAPSREVNGAVAAWSVTDYLLADIYDVLANANWQRANAGKKSPSARPKPYPRPGKQQGRSGGALPKTEFNDWYYRRGEYV